MIATGGFALCLNDASMFVYFVMKICIIPCQVRRACIGVFRINSSNFDLDVDVNRIYKTESGSLIACLSLLAS